MADIQSIGLIELSSVATGYQVEDVMLKAAKVQVLLARSICSGKFLIAVAGDVGGGWRSRGWRFADRAASDRARASIGASCHLAVGGDRPLATALHRRD